MNVHEWKVSFIPYYLVSRAEWSAPRPLQAINFLSREGFDGVEWMLGHHFNSPQELRRIVAETRRKGLKVSNLMCWEDFVTPDDRKRAQRIREIETYIALAGELSISVINTFTGPMTWRANHETVGRDLSEGRAWSLVVDSFSKILETAEKNEVTVTLEAVFGMLVHDYYTVKEFLSYFASKHMAVNLDPSHFALYGNDPAWALQMLGSKVRHVHVKDVVGRPGTFGADFIFAFLGEGNVDWKAFFSTLKKIGYSGFLSLEFENDVYLNNVCNGDWRIAARESKTRLHKLLRETGKPG